MTSRGSHVTLALDSNTRLQYSEGMSRNELDELRREAIRQGWRIVQAGRHMKWYPVDPDKPFVTTSVTPSDHRAIQNIKSDLRRSGLTLPQKDGRKRTR